MKYYSLNNMPILPKEIGMQKGIYIIHALYADGKPQKINRVLKVDPSGILYIGQSSKQTLKHRVDFFKRVSDPDKKATAHSGAFNIKQIKALRDKFPIESLYASVYPCENPKQYEKQQLEIYRQEFGEVPPLNGSK